MEAVLKRPRTFSRLFQQAHEESFDELNQRMSDGGSWEAYMRRARDSGKVKGPHEVMAKSARWYIEPLLDRNNNSKEQNRPSIVRVRHGQSAASVSVLKNLVGRKGGLLSRLVEQQKMPNANAESSRSRDARLRVAQEKAESAKLAQETHKRPNLNTPRLADNLKRGEGELVVTEPDTPVPLPSLPLETIQNLLTWLETQIPGVSVVIAEAVIQRQDRETAAVAFEHPDPQVGLVEFDLPRRDMPEGASSGDGISLLLLKMPQGVWESPDVIRTRLEGARLVPNLRPAAVDRWNDPERPLPEGPLGDDAKVQIYEEQIAAHHRKWDDKEYRALEALHEVELASPAPTETAYYD